MTNEAVYWDVDRAAYDAVYEAVDADVFWSLYDTKGEYKGVSWALYRVVYRTVGRAMDDASAKREKPPHPGLAFYLKEVG